MPGAPEWQNGNPNHEGGTNMPSKTPKKKKKKAAGKSSRKAIKDLAPRKDPKGGAAPTGDTLTLNLHGGDKLRPTRFRR